MANSALVSSSGCAGACMNVPETPSLRIARPSATWPLSCADDRVVHAILRQDADGGDSKKDGKQTFH